MALLAEEGGPNSRRRAPPRQLRGVLRPVGGGAFVRAAVELVEGGAAGVVRPPRRVLREAADGVTRAGDAERARRCTTTRWTGSRLPTSTTRHGPRLRGVPRRQGSHRGGDRPLREAVRGRPGRVPLGRAVPAGARRLEGPGKLAEAREGVPRGGGTRTRVQERGEGALPGGGWISRTRATSPGDGAFGELRLAADDATRQEGDLPHAYGLRPAKAIRRGVAAFRAGERGGFRVGGSARHRFWGARALKESGQKEEADRTPGRPCPTRRPASYALLALKERGATRSGCSTPARAGDGGVPRGARRGSGTRSWARPWAPRDAEKVRRAERLTDLGVVNYAVLEPAGGPGRREEDDRPSRRRLAGCSGTSRAT